MISYRDNQLYLEDIAVEEIVKGRQTPFYLYSLSQIKENIEKVHWAFEGLDYHISFAAKANNNLYLLEELKNLGVGIDIVSSGEFEACKRVGFQPSHVIVNGNGKTKSFLRNLVDYQPRAVNIDSLEELERLEELVNDCEESIVVALRINPDVDPITHPYISTGLKKNKFGMAMETAEIIIHKYFNHPFIKIEGLHLHIGSQLLYISPYEDAYNKVKEFINGLKNHQLKFINIGGGWGIDYTKDGAEFPLQEYKERVIPILKEFNMEIILELGRFIIGNAGVLVGSIEYIKETPHKTFIVSDASMADLIRPSLYNGYHHIYPQYNTGEEGIFDIVGPVCETGDRFAEDRRLNRPEKGELIVIGDVGAYGHVMSSNYNFSLRPAEYLLKNNRIEVVRPREDFQKATAYYNR